MPRLLPATLLAAAALLAGPAAAHTGAGPATGLMAGLAHPVMGADHLLAMVAVGLWGAMMAGGAFWLLPLAFMGGLGLGAVLGFAGLPLLLVEAGIALSVAAFGLALLLRARPALALAMGLAAFFALFHGHAHALEAPATASGLGYMAGMLVATAALHGLGLGLGVMLERLGPRLAERALGGAVTTAGLLFLAL